MSKHRRHGADFKQLDRRQTDAIKFVDVDRSLTVGSFDDWQRNYGHLQEKRSSTDFMSGISKKSKSKHQLTWLAAEAKERQQAVEQSWGQAAAAKRATNARYGF
jgi:proline-rich protein PRCC